MPLSQYLLLVFAWLLFGVVHSLFAAGALKRVAMRLMKRYNTYYRIFYSLLATIMFAWVLHTHFSITDPILWRPPLIEEIVAGILVIAGFAIMLVCIRKYFFYLSGLDALLKKNEPDVLQLNGMHQYVRHPLYFGTLLFVWAVFLGYPYMNNLVSCICITLYIWIGIWFEEKKLLLEYGEAYRDYRQRVPALLPKLF
jgi:protein-S-isoprenylcysteine O-methyltransferase Ste14